MMKIEELEIALLEVVDKFNEENKDVKISYTSNYLSGRITIKVTE